MQGLADPGHGVEEAVVLAQRVIPRSVPELDGHTYRETLLAFDGASVLGLLRDGAVLLNPPADEVCRAGDEVIAIAADDDDLVLDWALDSVRAMSFVGALRKAGVEVTLLELTEAPTLTAWWALISARSGASS